MRKLCLSRSLGTDWHRQSFRGCLESAGVIFRNKPKQGSVRERIPGTIALPTGTMKCGFLFIIKVVYYFVDRSQLPSLI